MFKHLVFKQNRILSSILFWITVSAMVIHIFVSVYKDLPLGWWWSIIVIVVILVPSFADGVMVTRLLKRFCNDCDVKQYLSIIEPACTDSDNKMLFTATIQRKQYLDVGLFYNGEYMRILENAYAVHNYINSVGLKLTNSIMYINAVNMLMNVYRELGNDEQFNIFYSEYKGLSARYPKNKSFIKPLEFNGLYAESRNGFNEDLINRINVRIAAPKASNLEKLEYYNLLKNIYTEQNDTDKVNVINDIIKGFNGNTIYNYREVN